MKKRNIYMVAFVLGILVLSSIALTIVSSTTGAEIAHLEKQKYMAKQEMEELSAKVVASTSLSEVSEIANELGLSKPQNVMYLNREASVASIQ